MGILLFPAAGTDDVYITYWPAYTLSQYGDILNYNGERIEQSSSLLHTLVISGAFSIFKANIVEIGALLSILFGLISIFLSGCLAQIFNQDKIQIQFLSALSVPILYWSFGGLETSLLTAIVLLCLISCIQYFTVGEKYLLPCIVSFGLYLLTRPEAIFVTSIFFITLIFIYWQQSLSTNRPIKLLFSSAVVFIFLVLFRFFYFNSFFPQPVEAKIGTSFLIKLLHGVGYIVLSIRDWPFLLILAVPFIDYLIRKRAKVLDDEKLTILLVFLTIYTAFIVTSGGDWMEAGRFFSPIITPAFIIAVTYYSQYFNKNTLYKLGIALNIFLLFYFSAFFSTSQTFSSILHSQIQKTDKEFSFFEYSNNIHYRDIPVVISMNEIVQAFNEHGIKPVIFSGQAGMVVFHTFQKSFNNATFIDRFGLTSRDFTDCKLTHNMEKTTRGLNVSMPFFLKHLSILQEQCSLQQPDVIFGLGSQRLDTIISYGYTPVHIQEGIISGEGLLKGKHLNGEEFIAIKTKWLDSIKFNKKTFLLYKHQWKLIHESSSIINQ